jgi:hypothetical protein
VAKSKESAGKCEATRRRIGTRGGTGAICTGVENPLVAALLGHAVLARVLIAAKSTR